MPPRYHIEAAPILQKSILYLIRQMSETVYIYTNYHQFIMESPSYSIHTVFTHIRIECRIISAKLANVKNAHKLFGIKLFTPHRLHSPVSPAPPRHYRMGKMHPDIRSKAHTPSIRTRGRGGAGTHTSHVTHYGCCIAFIYYTINQRDTYRAKPSLLYFFSRAYKYKIKVH